MLEKANLASVRMRAAGEHVDLVVARPQPANVLVRLRTSVEVAGRPVASVALCVPPGALPAVQALARR